jgi:tetratricopeptide (TPR) repeat protein
MTAFQPDPDRRLLPRFRASQAAVSSGDLRSFEPAKNPEFPASPDFEQLKLRWAGEKTAELAGELVCSGVILGQNPQSLEAAEFVLARIDAFAPELIRAATALVKNFPEIEYNDTLATTASTHLRIAALKRRLAEDPHNAIVWMDRAQLHTTLGQLEAAKRAVRMSVLLAPDNRFVLRAASRFYVRANDKVQGLHLLRTSRALKTDPWLMAAEIALSTVVHQPPSSFRRARAILLADDIDPWHTAELNGAFGTLAVDDRGVGKPSHFFRQSLRHPTENAIAQAQWFSNSHKTFEVPAQLLAQRMSFEAQALKAQVEKRWNDVITACRGWSTMDPTATRPLTLGSYIAEIALHNGRIALQFTDRWVTMEPTSSMAWNNHAVALAYAGVIEEARAALAKVVRSNDAADPVYLATQGLIEYRNGNPDAGRRLYIEAAEHDRSKGDRALRALIIWHLLREEARWDSKGVQSALPALWEKTKDVPVGELATMKQLIEQSAASPSLLTSGGRLIQLSGLPADILVNYLRSGQETPI